MDNYKDVQILAEENAVLRQQLTDLQILADALRDENTELKELAEMQMEIISKRNLTIDMLKRELKRLNKGFFNRPDKRLLEEFGIH